MSSETTHECGVVDRHPVLSLSIDNIRRTLGDGTASCVRILRDRGINFFAKYCHLQTEKDVIQRLDNIHNDYKRVSRNMQRMRRESQEEYKSHKYQPVVNKNTSTFTPPNISSSLQNTDSSKCEETGRVLPGLSIKGIVYGEGFIELLKKVSVNMSKIKPDYKNKTESIMAIQSTFACIARIKISEIRRNSNKPKYCIPRQFALFVSEMVLKGETKIFITETSGYATHATIYKTARMVQEKRSEDPEIDRVMTELIKAFKKWLC